MNKKHYILAEKYRPDTLEGYICNDNIRVKIQEFINQQDIPSLGFFGKAGSGKTTLAKILVKNIDCDYLYLNAADERSIDTMRDKVKSFAAAGSFKPIKIVVLDESTQILKASQVALLNMMETYSLTTRFILTGNYPERLIDPLRSRLQEFDLAPPTKKIVAHHIVNILNKENIKYDNKDVVTIIKKSYPDFRKTINNCQKYIINGELILNNSIDQDNDYGVKIIEELKKSSNKSFNNIRQIIADANIDNFDDLYRLLYEKLDEYSKNNSGILVCILEEHQYRATVVLDKEINIMSCISKILEIINNKVVF